MPDQTMLDMGDNLRSLEVLLSAAMEMDCRKEDENDIAFELIDKAIMRCRRLRKELAGEVHHG